MWRRFYNFSAGFCLSFRPFWRGSLPGGKNASLPRTRRRVRLAWLIFAAILLTPGCASLAAKPNPTMLPTKPVLTSLTVTSDGGIRMDKRDAAELLIYIEALERAAGVLQK